MKYSLFNTPYEEEKNNFTNFGPNFPKNFGKLKDAPLTNEIGKVNMSIQRLKNNLNPTKYSSIYNNEINSNRNLYRKMDDNKKEKTNKYISYKGKKLFNIIFNI